jgi:periplasmic divalent cation tolerance protein
VEQASEVMLLVKTTEDRRTEVVRVIDELHSYDLPAVSVVRVEAGSSEFERWVEESTGP